MKKILLASTALVGFAGAAAAEITLDGYAEIGVNGGNNGYETQFHNDWQVNFNFSSTTDGGLEFGGKVQIEESNGSGSINGNGSAGLDYTDNNNNGVYDDGIDTLLGVTQNGGPRIDDEAFWVSGSFGKVTLGETAGALDWAVPDVYSGTAISDDHSTHAGVYWNTGLDSNYDGQIARYEYSFGDYGVAVSLEQDDTGAGDPVIGLGGKWAGSVSGMDVSAGIGYQTVEDASTWSLAGKATMANGVSVALGYASFDHDTGADGILGTADDGRVFNTSDFVGNGIDVDNWWGLGVAYTTGALTVGANYSVYSATTAGVEDPKGWGLVANYDLGGGAVAMFGYGSSSGQNGGVEYGAGNGHGTETWSAGLGMSF